MSRNKVTIKERAFNREVSKDIQLSISNLTYYYRNVDNSTILTRGEQDRVPGPKFLEPVPVPVPAVPKNFRTGPGTGWTGSKIFGTGYLVPCKIHLFKNLK